jgi:Spy/CpxP family protein refolding chaperone
LLSRAASARLYKLERRYGLREWDIEANRFASMSESELQTEIERVKRELIKVRGLTPEQYEEIMRQGMEQRRKARGRPC